MTGVEITESGMKFGPYPEGTFFHIEKSDTYKAIEDGVKIAEFLLLTPSDAPTRVWVIEAKQSSPQPQTQPNLNDFIQEIREKLANTLTLCVASCLGRHPLASNGLPEGFKRLNLATAEFRLVLVIKGYESAWLPPLNDALKAALRPTVKTWALGPDSVAVINPHFSPTSKRKRAGCVRSSLCRREPDEGVCAYVEIGEQDEGLRSRDMRVCSRWLVRNAG